MPIVIAEPTAAARWEAAGIHALDADRAGRRDDRPLRVLLAGFAPRKIDSDLRVARLLGNSPIQVELTLLQAAEVPADGISAHLLHFYRGFAEVRERTFDGLVVTGHPGHEPGRAAEAAAGELEELIAWSRSQVRAGLFIGWPAEAALARLHGVPQRELPRRRIGVHVHRVADPGAALLRGHDRAFAVPVCRDRELHAADLPARSGLAALALAEEAGLHLVRHGERRHTFVLNQLDLEAADLERERRRAAAGGRDPGPAAPVAGWRAHGQLLVANWLNHDLLGGA